jgi:ElaB/YqjD/DUF883 family membrane-anchored ribosome-binding protein
MTNPSVEESVEAEDLLEQLQTVIDDSEALLKASATYAGDRIGRARERAHESLRAAKDRLGDVQDDVLEKTRHYVSQGNTYVRDNPWQAVGIAAAVGFLIGAVLVRSSSSR